MGNDGPCCPGEHPLTHCAKCAATAAVNLPTGMKFLEKAAQCLGGKNRYKHRTECEECLRNKDCKVPGCTQGGNGTTDPSLRLCREHLRLWYRQFQSARNTIQECNRCNKALTGENRTLSNGSLSGICQDCSQLCAKQDESGDFICNLHRVSVRGFSCYCNMHGIQTQLETTRAYKRRVRNGEPPKRPQWSKNEVKRLREIAKQHTKKWRNTKAFDGAKIATLLAAEFPPGRTPKALLAKLKELGMNASDY